MSARTEKIIMSNEARVLRQMRISKGLSMRAAGKLIGRSDSFISQVENGRMPISGSPMLEKILNAYGDGIKVKSFYEKARLLKHLLTPKEELLGLIARLNDLQTRTVLMVVKGLVRKE